MSEIELMREIQVEASKLGARLFRNNNGNGWVGQAIVVKQQGVQVVHPGDVVIRNARPFIAGLGVGTSDLIGFTPLVVTESHVGQTLAVFTACEVKYGKGKLTKEQDAFLKYVNTQGGIGCETRSLGDVAHCIHKLRAP